jgi:hypothetical protein
VLNKKINDPADHTNPHLSPVWTNQDKIILHNTHRQIFLILNFDEAVASPMGSAVMTRNQIMIFQLLTSLRTS